MLYRQLSKLAVVGERSESPKANQSRLRRPTPYSIEHYRHEGVRASSPPADSPRGRSQSSTWTPTRTRAPTPHPSATKSRRRKEERTVQWTDPLEQESPEQKSAPVPAPSKKKSAMKRGQATKQEEEKSTQKEGDSEAPSKQKSDDTAATQEVNPCTLRRDRRSSIPRPKRTITTSNKPRRIFIPERPLSPLIPPAVPAPLQLSHRQTRINAIPSSTSAPAITSKTAARDFSFDRKSEVITVRSRSVHQNRPFQIATTTNKLLQSGSTSYLQTRPKRAGTTRARPTSPNAECKRAGAEDSSELKNPSPAASRSPLTTKPDLTGSLLPNLSFTPFFHDVKTFGTEKSSSTSTSASDSDSDHRTSKPGVTVDVLPGCSSPSKLTWKPLPSSTPVSSFDSAKSFWSGLSTSSSCGAIVSGSGPDPNSKPALSMAESRSSSSKGKDLPKTPMVSRLYKYTSTVNRDTRSGEKRAARGKVDVSGSVSSTAARVTGRSRLPRSSSGVPFRPVKRDMTALGGCSNGTTSSPQLHIQEHSRDGSSSVSSASKSTASSSTSYHTAKSHLSDISASNTDTNIPISMTATSSSMETEYIPTVQSELWNEIMDFCRSDSSSVPSEERYCDCEDCVWGEERDVAACSTVVRVGEREKCRARR